MARLIIILIGVAFFSTAEAQVRGVLDYNGYYRAEFSTAVDGCPIGVELPSVRVLVIPDQIGDIVELTPIEKSRNSVAFEFRLADIMSEIPKLILIEGWPERTCLITGKIVGLLTQRELDLVDFKESAIIYGVKADNF